MIYTYAYICIHIIHIYIYMRHCALRVAYDQVVDSVIRLLLIAYISPPPPMIRTGVRSRIFLPPGLPSKIMVVATCRYKYSRFRSLGPSYNSSRSDALL